MSDQRAVARQVGSCVSRKIRVLQRAYCEGTGSSGSGARATLARLRRLDDAQEVSWIANGSVLFDGKLLNGIESSRDQERALKAMRATLELYAWHQQSQTNGKAMLREKDETKEELGRRRLCSFGSACRRIQPSLDDAAGVQRRLESAEAATNFDGVIHYVRGLIKLMRSCPDADRIQLDYYALAYDLYLLQLPNMHDEVFMRWGKDYYTFFDQEAGDADLVGNESKVER